LATKGSPNAAAFEAASECRREWG